MNAETLKQAIRDVPDFPKPGILFKDITPLLADPKLFRAAVDLLADRHAQARIDKVAVIEARGFTFGTPCSANRLSAVAAVIVRLRQQVARHRGGGRPCPPLEFGLPRTESCIFWSAAA